MTARRHSLRPVLMRCAALGLGLAAWEWGRTSGGFFGSPVFALWLFALSALPMSSDANHPQAEWPPLARKAVILAFWGVGIYWSWGALSTPMIALPAVASPWLPFSISGLGSALSVTALSLAAGCLYFVYRREGRSESESALGALALWCLPPVWSWSDTHSPEILAVAAAVFTLALVQRGRAALGGLLFGAVASVSPFSFFAGVLLGLRTHARSYFAGFLASALLSWFCVWHFSHGSPPSYWILPLGVGFGNGVVLAIALVLAWATLRKEISWPLAVFGAVMASAIVGQSGDFGYWLWLALLFEEIDVAQLGTKLQLSRAWPWALGFGTRALILGGFFSTYSDLPYFFGVFEKVANGARPYLDVALGYPPLGWVFVLLPGYLAKALSTNPEALFQLLFRAQILVFDFWIIRILNRTVSRWGVVFYLFLTTALAPLFLDRLDLVVGATSLSFLLALRSEPSRKKALLSLALGASVKWVPLLLLPLRAWQSAKLRSLGWKVVSVTLAGLFLFWCFYRGTGSKWLAPIEHTLQRGVQVETIWAQIAIFWTWVAPHSGAVVRVIYGFASHQISGGMAPALKAISVFSLVFALGWVYWTWFRRKGRERGADVVQKGMLCLLLVPILGWVSSSQFLLWGIPLAPVVVAGLEGKRRMRFFGFFCAATLLNALGFWNYISLTEMHLVPALIVFGRNLCMIGAAVPLICSDTARA